MSLFMNLVFSYGFLVFVRFEFWVVFKGEVFGIGSILGMRFRFFIFRGFG